MRLRRPLASLAVAALLIACGGETNDAPPSAEPTETGAPQEDDAADDPDLREAVDLAIEDAASTRGVVEREIEVMDFEEVSWPDDAFGCADREATTRGDPIEGYVIVLDAAGETMYYHGEQGEPPFHCEEPLTGQER